MPADPDLRAVSRRRNWPVEYPDLWAAVLAGEVTAGGQCEAITRAGHRCPYNARSARRCGIHDDGTEAILRHLLFEHKRYLHKKAQLKAAQRRRQQRQGPGWRTKRKRWLEEHPDCEWCPAPAAEVDHITPLAMGGTSESDNLRSLCTSCHRSNADSWVHWSPRPLNGEDSRRILNGK